MLVSKFENISILVQITNYYIRLRILLKRLLIILELVIDQFSFSNNTFSYIGFKKMKLYK